MPRGRKKELEDPVGLTIWIDLDSYMKLQELKEKMGKSVSRIIREVLKEKGLI